MKKLVPFFLVLFVFTACANDRNAEKAVSGNPVSVTTNDTAPAQPTPVLKDTATGPNAYTGEAAPKEKAGVHPITLHWIGWDKQGKATVTPAGDGWYNITGQQKTDDLNYLRIDGRIRRLSEKELEFEGSIETRVQTIFSGEPCIRKGKQRFFGKGTRTYFRLQHMENCEGENLVDYVDIYPGTSSL